MVALCIMLSSVGGSIFRSKLMIKSVHKNRSEHRSLSIDYGQGSWYAWVGDTKSYILTNYMKSPLSAPKGASFLICPMHDFITHLLLGRVISCGVKFISCQTYSMCSRDIPFLGIFSTRRTLSSSTCMSSAWISPRRRRVRSLSVRPRSRKRKRVRGKDVAEWIGRRTGRPYGSSLLRMDIRLQPEFSMLLYATPTYSPQSRTSFFPCVCLILS